MEAHLESSKDGSSLVSLAVIFNSQTRISQSTDEDIKKSLKHAFILLGLTEKDVPEGIEKVVLLDFIKGEYGNRFSPEEIVIAFRWALARRTNVDKSFYGKRFSCSYLSNFMEAYEIKKKELLELARRNERPRIELVEDSRSLRDRLKSHYEIIEKFVLENKKLPLGFDVHKCFGYLDMEALLDLSQENIARMQALAENEMRKELNTARLKANDIYKVKDLLKKLNDLNEIDFQTKKKFVEAYLMKLIS